MSIGGAKAAGAMGFTPVAVYDEENPYIHHFPDGNAGVARALVKKMIPQVGPGNNAEEIVLSKKMSPARTMPVSTKVERSPSNPTRRFPWTTRFPLGACVIGLAGGAR